MKPQLLLIIFAAVSGGQVATNWNQEFPHSSPSPRIQSAMAYHSIRGQIVLFGGIGAGPSSPTDTWAWDGVNWTRQFPQTSPPGRYGHAMAYDSAHGQIVLFGGANPQNRSELFSETWVWDGVNWTQQFPQNAPSARQYQAMAYDSRRLQVVVFGGYFNGAQAGDTWIWDGTNWTQQSPQNSPSARSGEAMVYDSAHDQIVLFGGYDNENYLNDTWVWDGTNWTQKVPLTRPSRVQAMQWRTTPHTVMSLSLEETTALP